MDLKIDRHRDAKRDEPREKDDPREKKQAGAPRSAAPAFSRVQFSICSVTCEKTTGEMFKKDKMLLVAVETNVLASVKDGKKCLDVKSRRAETLDLGKFKKGDERSFPEGRPVAQFPLASRQAHWPCRYLVTLALVELDGSKLETVLDAVIDAIDEKVLDLLTKTGSTVATAMLTGLTAGTMFPIPLLGSAMGALVGALGGVTFAAMKKARQDDVFPPKSVELVLEKYPDKAGDVPQSRKLLQINGCRGEYKVGYKLEIV